MAKAKTTTAPNEAESTIKEAEELEIVLGLLSKEVVIGEETVTARKFKFRDVPGVIRTLAKLYFASVKTVDSSLLYDDAEAAAKIIAASTGKDVEWILELDGVDGVRLFNAVLEVNERFFTEDALPKLLSNALRVAGAATNTLNSLQS